MAKEKQFKHQTNTDERFWWNQYLLKDLISQKVDAKWMIYLIQVKAYYFGKRKNFS